MTEVDVLRAAPHDRLAALLGHGVSSALIGRLVGSARLRTRLAGLISSRLGDLGELDRHQVSALAMTPDGLLDLSTRAGVVWNGAAIARIIDGASRRALLVALGEHRYSLALAGLGLAQPGATLDPSPDGIVAAVAADGAACLAAWCEAQPATVAGRLRLIRPDGSPGTAHAMSGPAIVAWLLER